MTAMTTTGTSGIPHGRPFTVADLEAMPDDGNRYELIDGALFVSPAPSRRHQRVLLKLAFALESACTDEYEVLAAPFSVRLSDQNEVQPDVLVARASDLTDTILPVAPMLAVEVLSPSSIIHDLNTKKAVYERMGAPSYWVVDPEHPSIKVFELDDHNRYQLLAEVKGEDAFEAEFPFPVRIVPVELLGRLAR